MADITVPQSLVDRINLLERQVRALRAPQLQNSSLTGGKITALNDTGQRVAEYGSLVGGGYGLAVNDADTLESLFIMSDDDGLVTPDRHHNWRDATNGFVNVTAGAFTPVYRTVVLLPVARVVRCVVTTIQAAATTGELRLTIEGVASTSTKTLPAGVQTETVFMWAHGQSIGLGGFAQSWVLEARRTAGAGNVTVYEPDGLFEASALTPAGGGLLS